MLVQQPNFLLTLQHVIEDGNTTSAPIAVAITVSIAKIMMLVFGVRTPKFVSVTDKRTLSIVKFPLTENAPVASTTLAEIAFIVILLVYGVEPQKVALMFQVDKVVKCRVTTALVLNISIAKLVEINMIAVGVMI